MNEGSYVGLDVHARSVVAGVIDLGSGEVRSQRVPPGSDATVAWLKTLPGPVRVVYEAGPTGYGLARACEGAGISCVVAAPSKIRPAADRVKTDRRDAERLARLLRLGEITPVRVPGPDEEAARDLVRAREDARGDLMRARHRLSKLLLRHGAVYDATAWTRAHDAWLRKQRFQGGDDGITAHPNGSARRAHRRTDARSDPRAHCEQPATATLAARERLRSSSRTPGHAAPTRAYESRHSRRRQPMRSPRRTRTPRNTGAIDPRAVDRPLSI
jgi:transposase